MISTAASNFKSTVKQNIYILIILITILSCNNPPNHSEKAAIENTETDYAKYHTQQDTILIALEIGSTLKFAKSDFNKS